MIIHKLGDSFERLLAIDGSQQYLTWDAVCRIKSEMGVSVDSFPCEVVTGAQGKKYLRLFKIDTSLWKEGTYRMDVAFTRTSDGFIQSSTVIDLVVSRTGGK
uniref:Uncharacterized protein n=1 Tax=Pseudomonas phage Cygsa01 TaxID=3138529 RepID=A0AAU6W3M4_9VIRU